MLNFRCRKYCIVAVALVLMSVGDYSLAWAGGEQQDTICIVLQAASSSDLIGSRVGCAMTDHIITRAFFDGIVLTASSSGETINTGKTQAVGVRSASVCVDDDSYVGASTLPLHIKDVAKDTTLPLRE